MEYGGIGPAGENVVYHVAEEYRHASETVTVHFTAEQTALVPMKALKRAIRNRVLVRNDGGWTIFLFQISGPLRIYLFY